jgi:pimeloyl-ACP methyl ester carboxylesterase
VPLIIGAPPDPTRIVRSLLRRPRATLAVMRFGVQTMAPTVKLIKAGRIEESIARFARGVLGAEAYAQLPEHVRAHMRANAATHVGQFLAGGGFEPIAECDIASVRTPALVVTGANSPAMFQRLAALLATLLPDSRRLEVPFASHAMHVENPVALNAGLLSFLASVS